MAENNENKAYPADSYKNIKYQQKNGIGENSDVATNNVKDSFWKKDSNIEKKTVMTTNDDSTNIKEPPIFSRMSIIDKINLAGDEDIEDDGDDEDYVIGEEEQNETEDDYFDENEYEEEIEEEGKDEEDLFYFNKIMEENERNEKDIIYEKEHINEFDETNQTYNNFLYEQEEVLSNDINQNYSEKDFIEPQTTVKSESCYSCTSQQEGTPLDKLQEDGNKLNDNTDFMLDVMERIDEIYYKESKYKNLKEVNNSNNNVCINDLNLNLISDYLNVNISVFHKKCTILLIGNTQSGKSSFINWLSENYVQNTNCLQKKNQITYVDVKNNFKFNLKNASNVNYQLGMLNELRNYREASSYPTYRFDSPSNVSTTNKMVNGNKNVLIPGDQCSSFFKPFEKLKQKANNMRKYIRAKICIQNNFIKYMNRVNSVSFIDTSGINDTPDNEYDDIVMNLSKYVDLIFIFIDSNKYAINDRLLRIINYVMDYQISKVTICLTRIDLVKKVDLYRVVFYLTQYFLKNLHVFKFDILNNYAYCHDGIDNEEMSEEQREERKKHNELYMLRRKKNGIYPNNWNDVDGIGLKKQKTLTNVIFQKSFNTFKNVIILPKLLKRIIQQNPLRKEFNFTKGNKQLSRTFRKFISRGNISSKGENNTNQDRRCSSNLTRHRKRESWPYSPVSLSKGKQEEEEGGEEEEGEDDNDEKEADEKEQEHFGGGLLKKIMTKRFSSFKEKLLDDNLMNRLNKSGSVTNNESDTPEESVEEEDEERENTDEEIEEDREEERKEEEDEDDDDDDEEITETEAETENDKHGENYYIKKHISKRRMSDMPTDVRKRRMSCKRNFESGYKKYLSEKGKKKKNRKKKHPSWKAIRYIDCVKNICVFVLVLVYGITRTTYNILYRLIKSYFGDSEKTPSVKENLPDSEKDVFMKNKNDATSSQEILEFLTIYLPEIPRDAFKMEKWKFDADNINANSKRRRYSCYAMPNPSPSEDNASPLYMQENAKRLQRRSIPLEFLMGGHGGEHGAEANKNRRSNVPLRIGSGNTDIVTDEQKQINRNTSTMRLTRNSARLQRMNNGSEFDNVREFDNLPNRFQGSSTARDKITARRSLQPTGTAYKNNYSANVYNNGKLPKGRHSIAFAEKSQESFVNEKRVSTYSRMHNATEKNVNYQYNTQNKINNYYTDYNNIYNYECYNPNVLRQNEVSDLNMIQELLFKIDESIDFKTNQSIYLLKKDLQKIQENCLKRISDNNEILKKNKSLRIQKLQFYFFHYMAIIMGSFISLLRYDLLVYFNFINPELIFSIFSKYFLFLSSYNKNSLFIMANIILVISYSYLYVRYKKKNYFKSLDKSDLNKLKIIMLFTQIIFDEINQLHMKLLGKKNK